jgi:SHS2 domain-containing protein
LAQTTEIIAHWEHFGHGADIGVRGIGATIAETFEQAAIALTEVITDSTKVIPRREIRIERTADGAEALLVVV